MSFHISRKSTISITVTNKTVTVTASVFTVWHLYVFRTVY